MWESYGNHTNSTSRVLKTGRDLIGVRAALGDEQTVPRVVQVREPDPAPVGAVC